MQTRDGPEAGLADTFASKSEYEYCFHRGDPAMVTHGQYDRKESVAESIACPLRDCNENVRERARTVFDPVTRLNNCKSWTAETLASERTIFS